MATQRLGYTGTPNQVLSTGGIGYLTTALASGTLVAAASVSATKMFIYKYSADVNAVGIAALYDASNNLLASTSFNISGAAGWREVTISAVNLVAGNTYRPMLKAGDANCLMYSDTSGNACSRSAITTPPNPWTEVQNRSYCPAIYLEYDDGASAGNPAEYYAAMMGGAE